MPAPPDGTLILEELCRSLTAVTAEAGLAHASITRWLGNELSDLIYETGVSARALIDLPQTLGEGPTVLAAEERKIVLIADLTADPLAALWLLFASEAKPHDVGAVYALPLQIGALALGVLTLHGPYPVSLEPAMMADILKRRDVISLALLAPAASAKEIDDWDGLLSRNYAVINQAAGMVMAQLGSSMDEAVLRIRAHALGEGLSLTDVATKVVGRSLRFRPDTWDDSSSDGMEERHNW